MQQADPLSRGVLSSVCVCVCVCVIKRVHFQPSAMNRYEEVSLLKKKKISIC